MEPQSESLLLVLYKSVAYQDKKVLLDRLEYIAKTKLYIRLKALHSRLERIKKFINT